MGLTEDLIGTELNDLEILERIEDDFNEERERLGSTTSSNVQPAKLAVSDKQVMKIDEILKKSGGFAKYQVFLVLCLGLGGAMYVSVQNLSMTFVEATASWKCVTQKCRDITDSSNDTILYDTTTLCQSGLVAEDWEWVNANHTALSDFGQACGTQTVITNVLYFCPGVMVGGIIFGIMGWSTGRKTPFLSALLTSMVASVISAATKDYILFVILRILLGASIAGYELLYFCWIVELVARKWRPIAVGIQAVFGAAGLLIVFYINERWEYWRYKMVYVGIVSLVFIFVYAAVPESPYWLLAKGQDDVATMILKKIAILNGHQYPEAQVATPSIKVREKVISYFKPKYKRIGALLCINWVLVGMVYYHIFLNIAHYGPPVEGISVVDLKKTNFIMALIVELPAALIGASLLSFFMGRKYAYIFNIILLMCCVGVSLADYTVIEGWDMKRCAILVGAKWAITAAKLILALWTAELCPSTIRTLMFGLCMGASACGVVFSSILIFFSVSHFITVIVILVLAVICITACTQILDTHKWDLPDHLYDVFRYINNNNLRPVYSEMSLEAPPATVL